MDYISNFIVQSPLIFLGCMLILALVFFITSMYFLFKKAKKEDQIKKAVIQKKIDELKAHEEYKAKFKGIHQVRKKFKELKRKSGKLITIDKQ